MSVENQWGKTMASRAVRISGSVLTRYRRDWAASCAIVLSLIALAGCERSQRLSRPAYLGLASSTSSWDTQAAGTTNQLASASAKTKTTIARAESKPKAITLTARGTTTQTAPEEMAQKFNR
jgi:hypothetical protein